MNAFCFLTLSISLSSVINVPIVKAWATMIISKASSSSFLVESRLKYLSS